MQEPHRCDVCQNTSVVDPCLMVAYWCCLSAGRMEASTINHGRGMSCQMRWMVRSACHRVATGLVSVLVVRRNWCMGVPSGALQAFHGTSSICSSPEEAHFWTRLVCRCAGLPNLQCFSYNLEVVNLCAAAAGRARSADIVIVLSGVIQICRGADRLSVQRPQTWVAQL